MSAPATSTAPAVHLGGEPMDIGSPPHNNHRDTSRESRHSPGPSNNNVQYDSEADHGRSDNERSKNSSPPDQSTNSQNNSNMPAPPTAAAAAIHQPKIVQTAFIHKLYKSDNQSPIIYTRLTMNQHARGPKYPALNIVVGHG